MSLVECSSMMSPEEYRGAADTVALSGATSSAAILLNGTNALALAALSVLSQSRRDQRSLIERSIRNGNRLTPTTYALLAMHNVVVS